MSPWYRLLATGALIAMPPHHRRRDWGPAAVVLFVLVGFGAVMLCIR
jgi:hypothetical protein